MSKIIKYYILICIFLAACARPLPPSGGPPDKTPPVIASSYPESNRLNYNEGYVSFEFSKYMNNNSVIENIYIIPDIKVSYDWSGKELEIEFDEVPDTNTTYAVTLGTEYSDYLGNKPEESYTLVFSTGSKIDSGSIRGIIQDKNPSGVELYAYRLDDINPDTLNPTATMAGYRSQAGTNGNFGFMALKDGKYRIMAVRDALRDGIYSEGADDFGAYTQDITVRQDTVPVISMKIGGKIDKVKPKLYNAESYKSRIIRAYFDEKPDSLTINKNSFLLTDTTGRDTIAILSACISFAEQNCVELFCSVPLDTAKKWKLAALADGPAVIKDSAGNSVDDTANIAYLSAVGDIDYPKPEISRMPFRDSSGSVSRFNAIDFILSAPVDASNIINRVKFIKLQDSTAVDFDLIMFFDNVISLKPRKPLENDQWYGISIDMMKISDFFGTAAPDTVYMLRFKTEDTRNYGRISGTLTDSSKLGGDIFLILESADSKTRRILNAGPGGKWEFESLPPGDYLIEIFCDTDKNGVYTYGNAFPFKFAEPFKKLKDVLSLKPRWNIDDIKIVF